MLVRCHECGKSVSTEAASCPTCGAPVRQPLPRQPVSSNPVKRHIGPIVLLTLMAAGIIVVVASRDEKAGKDLAQADAACRASLECWGDRNLSKAEVYCKASIERLALHSVKWTDQGGYRKFSRYRWRDQPAGAVTYIGDRVEFQNGFGAYTPVVYACDIGDLDTASPQVLDARVVSEGRLPP